MKRLILLIALILCLCFAGTEVFANTINEDEMVVEENNLANSWRYKEGKPLDQTAEDTLKLKTAPYHSKATRTGIDVSSWQGTINWEKVKASGVDFAIIRCGYGMDQKDQDDSQFLRNVTECERLGIPYGVYIYSYATNTTRAASEAEHVLRLIKGHKLSYPVYFDMEDRSTIGCDYANIAKTFCNKISDAGYPVGVYANLNWWNNYLTDSCFSRWHRWVAQYYSTCQYQKEYAIWQYTSSGTVNGISGKVDMNYLIGYPADHGSYTTSVTEGTYTISSKENDNLVLTVKDSSMNNNAAIEASDSSNVSSSQRFEIINVGNKQYKILAEHSGKALDIQGSNASSGANIQQYEWHSANAQTWEFVNAGDGYYYLKSKLGTYLKLDSSNGNRITTDTFNISDAQKWKLNVSEYKPIENGIYNIMPKLNEAQSLDVYGMSVSDRANIYINKSNNNISQQFFIQYVGRGYYKIAAEHSNKSLDVENSSQYAGANVQQYTYKGVNAQLWKFVDAGDGYYYLKSKLGTVLSISSDDAAVGANVAMNVMDDKDALKWKLSAAKMDKISDGIYSIKNASNTRFAVTQKNNNIQVNAFRNLLEQKFQIEHVKDGYYKIEDIATGYVFDVTGGSKNINSNLQIHEWNGTDAQLWRIIKLQNNKYILKSKLGTFIDISSGKAVDDANCLLYSFVNLSNQNWILTKEDLIYVDEPEQNLDENISMLFENNTSLRYGGNDRYETSLLTANALKKSLNISKFDNIIIAYGEDYPDALTGSYLAYTKDAPILLFNKSQENSIKKYVTQNLSKNGTVYLLGGTGVISNEFEKSLKTQADVKRLGGKTRYETNLEILKEAGNISCDIMICSGFGFADSLSVSSACRPILLVDENLSDSQKTFLNNLEAEKVYIIGGTGAVSNKIESACLNYGDVIRLAGNNRYTTSVAVALGLFGNWNKCAIFACGSNFPDGLTGGALAASLSVPILLIDDGSYIAAEKYVKSNGVIKNVILGGQGVLSNQVINKIMN